MAVDPRPLESGECLADRYTIDHMLGRGGFGIAYAATDSATNEEVVIKELAPQGCRRTSQGVVELFDPSGAYLRERFLEEAGVLSRLRFKGVPEIRGVFRQNGTAYFVTDYLPGALTVEALVGSHGPLSSTFALNVFHELLDILDQVHRKRILHRDIKPSNILVGEGGDVYLIDFGAAREWHADATVRHTVLYTPGFAPPEQLSERARRGPATDIYGLCATMLVMLTGQTPPSVADRAAGCRLPSLANLRPDLDLRLVNTIESGLSLNYSERPQTIDDLREMLVQVNRASASDTLAQLDDRRLRLKQFRFEKRACPACRHVISSIRPLRRGICPVCQRGTIRSRNIQERACPICRSGILHHLKNGSPLSICPTCCSGQLHFKRKNLLSADQFGTCDECDARYEFRANQMSLMTEDPPRIQSCERWRVQSRRSEDVWKCSDCPAQFDGLPDGRWRLAKSGLGCKYQSLYPDEWARVAIGLEPGSGNAECEVCGADYFMDRHHLTLLDAKDESNLFAESYLGRLLSLDDVRWYAAGKTSPFPGLLCEECHTEFDQDGEYWRLVSTSTKRLAPHVGKPKRLEDWQRLAQDLPTLDDEESFIQAIDDAIRNGYRVGEFGFDTDGKVLWRGQARRLDEENSVNFLITLDEILIGGLLKKKRYPLDLIVAVWSDDIELHIQLSGERSPLALEITPETLTARLASGPFATMLNARDLAARLDRITASH